MINKPLKIGILCSGNTCRSPIFAAWLKQILPNDSHLEIWTAGMSMKDYEVGCKVKESAILAAKKLNLDKNLITELENHKSIKVENITESANLIIWITDFENINAEKEGSNIKRIDFINTILIKYNAILVILPEKDEAHEKSINVNSTKKEIDEAYLAQSIRLKEWAEIIYKTSINRQ